MDKFSSLSKQIYEFIDNGTKLPSHSSSLAFYSLVWIQIAYEKTKPLLDKKGSPQRVGIFESKEDIFNFIYDLLIGVRSHSKKRGKIRKIINLYPGFKTKKFLLKIVNKTFIGSN